MTAGPIRRTSVREVYMRRAQAAGEGREKDRDERGVDADARPRLAGVIFRGVGDRRPYPEHGLVTPKEWSVVPPRQVRLDELVTTKATLSLDSLLSDDSTFYGDLFAHVVQFKGVMYLEDGLHRAVRAALQQRAVLHARVLVLPDDAVPAQAAPTPVSPATPSSDGLPARAAASVPATPALPSDDDSPTPPRTAP